MQLCNPKGNLSFIHIATKLHLLWKNCSSTVRYQGRINCKKRHFSKNLLTVTCDKKEELNQLKDIERPKASQAIADARDKGDLSENAEYDAAKESQGLLELKISKLEETLSNARVINESNIDHSKVLILSTIDVKNLSNNSIMTYTLVAESEADLANGKISINSPIGKGLLGKKKGDKAIIPVPSGKIELEILKITR